METNERFFNRLSTGQINFFYDFCEKGKIEWKFEEKIFKELIQESKEKKDQMLYERKEKTYLKPSYNFATDSNKFKPTFPNPSKEEKELGFFIHICEIILANIRTFRNKEEQIEIEIKERKSRLTKESIQLFYWIINVYCNEKIAIDRIVKRKFDEDSKFNLFNSVESLKTSFSTFIKNHKEDEQHRKMIEKYLKEKEKRKTVNVN